MMQEIADTSRSEAQATEATKEESHAVGVTTYATTRAEKHEAHMQTQGDYNEDKTKTDKETRHSLADTEQQQRKTSQKTEARVDAEARSPKLKEAEATTTYQQPTRQKTYHITLTI